MLRLFFGLDDGNSRTLEEIGRMMGVTRERISQLRDRALLRLREGETGQCLRDFSGLDTSCKTGSPIPRPLDLGGYLSFPPASS